VDLGVDEQARAIWLENRLHLRRKCPTCWCRFICGGGCRAESLEHEEDYTRPYGAACVILQMVIAQTIELLSGLTDAQLRLLVKSDGPGVTPHGPA
jgi:sulfatase maturation enzyme AslB (radical SAM superfamily)